MGAVAGSGKSTVAGGLLAAANEVLKRRKEGTSLGSGRRPLMVWLTANRSQRDEALDNTRKVLQNPLSATAIGRPASLRPAEVDDNFFDPVMERAFRLCLEPQHTRVDDLLKQVKACEQDACNEASELKTRKVLEEKLVRAHFELDCARRSLLQQGFKEIDIVCMTVDGFNHVMGGSSHLSSLFAECEISLAIVDEVHQLHAHTVGAVACNVKEMISFFDAAQRLDSSSNTECRN